MADLVGAAGVWQSRAEVLMYLKQARGELRALQTPTASAAQHAKAGPSVGRETAIIRQTCLKTAAEFCASRPALKAADLLALTERREAWVTRD